MTYLNNNTIDLRRFFAAVKRFKWLYVAATVVLMAGSIYFALTREAKYTLNATMLVESDDNSGGFAGLGQMMGLSVPSMFGGTSLENELVVAQSNAVYERIVKKLQLNRKYFLRKGFMNKQSLYDDSPLRLVAADDVYFDTVSAGMQFKVKLKQDGTADVKVVRGFFTTLYEQKGVQLPASMEIDGTRFSLLTTDCYAKGEPMEISIAVTNNNSAVEALSESLSIIPFDKVSSAMLLVYSDPHLQRGKDVLNTLIAMYLDQRILSKNAKTSRGLEVIDAQLDTAYANLVKSESQLELFKIKNNITDIPTELEISLNTTASLDASMTSYRTQLIICDLMLKFLRSEESKYSLLPISNNEAASSDMSIANQYNELVIQRMRLLRSAKPDNATLAEVTASIDALREAVIASVEQQKRNLGTSMAEQEKRYNEFTSRLENTPRLEREYSDLARNNGLNNQIYLFLLNKKTEYEMQQASSELPATVVDEAYCPKNEASNMGSIIFPVIGLFFSLLFPTMFVIFMLWRQKTVEHEYDMPLAVKQSNHSAYEDIPSLRPALLARNASKLLPVAFGDECSASSVCDAITDLAQQIGNTGRNVIVIDIDNVYGGDCQLGGNLDNPPTSAFDGIDHLAYSGSPSDLLLNGQFQTLVSSLENRYDSIMLLFKNSTDTNGAVANIVDDKTATVVMVQRGHTKRGSVARVVKACPKDKKLIFWIY